MKSLSTAILSILVISGQAYASNLLCETLKTAPAVNAAASGEVYAGHCEKIMHGKVVMPELYDLCIEFAKKDLLNGFTCASSIVNKVYSKNNLKEILEMRGKWSDLSVVLELGDHGTDIRDPKFKELYPAK